MNPEKFEFNDYLQNISNLPSKEFKLIEFIDEGTYGQVYKAKHLKTDKIYSIKIINNISLMQNLILESSLLKFCSTCKYINKYHGSYYDYISKEIWLILDHCKYGNIMNIISTNNITLNEKQISAIIKMVLKSLVFLHSNGIIHRDIKGGNLLLNEDGIIELCDFGTGTLLKCVLDINDDENGKKIGSPYWMAPEIVINSTYSTAGDIWSLGITCIELVEGNPPYSNIKPLRAMLLTSTDPPKGLSTPNSFSKEFNNFVKKCLTVDFNKRPSASELLNDTFIAQYNDEKNKEAIHDLINTINNNTSVKTLKNINSNNNNFKEEISYEDIKKDLFQNDKNESVIINETSQSNTVVVKDVPSGSENNKEINFMNYSGIMDFSIKTNNEEKSNIEEKTKTDIICDTFRKKTSRARQNHNFFESLDYIMRNHKKINTNSCTFSKSKQSTFFISSKKQNKIISSTSSEFYEKEIIQN